MCESSTSPLIQGVLKIMAWTKARMAAVAVATVIVATGTITVVIKAVHSTKAIHIPINVPINGLPETLAELDAWYVEPPAGQNAATFNLRGIKAMQIKG